MTYSTEYLQYWVQTWCACLDYTAANYAVYKIGIAFGFSYTFPLTDDQIYDILAEVDNRTPHIYTWAKSNPRVGDWIVSLSQVQEDQLIQS